MQADGFENTESTTTCRGRPAMIADGTTGVAFSAGLTYGQRMKSSIPGLFFLTLAAVSPAVAETYRETVLAENPAVYWRFENATGNTVRDESGLADSQSVAAGPGRRGVAGLAAAFDRIHRTGRIESRLDPEQDLTIENIFNGTFTLEFWLLDAAARPDNSINYGLFYKADTGQFTRNSLWFYRARQDGHYHFRIHGR
ncbi:MAG: hypothetical protein VB858_14760, partial [Planctomycetaceae bacterium]